MMLIFALFCCDFPELNVKDVIDLQLFRITIKKETKETKC